MQSEKAAPEEMCLKATVLTLRAVVNIPDPGVDDWKRSRSATIESHVERKVSAGDEAQFIGEVRRRCSLSTFGDKDSQLVVHPLCRLQPVQSTKDRSDVVVPRLGKHQLISRLDAVMRYASGCSINQSKHISIAPYVATNQRRSVAPVSVIQLHQDRRCHE